MTNEINRDTTQCKKDKLLNRSIFRSKLFSVNESFLIMSSMEAMKIPTQQKSAIGYVCSH